MKDRNYIWDPGTFKVLGISFSTTINSIVEINYRGKIEKRKLRIGYFLISLGFWDIF